MSTSHFTTLSPLLGQAVPRWVPAGPGSVQPLSNTQYPGLTRLQADGSGLYRQFDLEYDDVPLAGTVYFGSDDYYGIYLELDTNRGRRQVKCIPTDDAPRRFSSVRYQVGLGRDSRRNGIVGRVIDTQSIASIVEPGTTVNAITKVFVRTKLSVDIALAPAPDTPEPPDEEITREAAVRFLNQATFGATEQSIAQLMALGSYSAWIDQQMNAPISRTGPQPGTSYGSNSRLRHYPWWDNALGGGDQLRQRVAFALSQIFVVSDLIDKALTDNPDGVSGYYDMLAAQAFGSYRALLEHVTLHPVMGDYLSMAGNQKADPAKNVRPDENFAREILQLFSIGLVELLPNGQPRLANGRAIPSYDQELVEEFAKVFTGWYFEGALFWLDTNRGRMNLVDPMVPTEEYHDRSAKRLLSGTLPAGQNARRDLEMALDQIAGHANVGPFMATALIKRLVTSNPSAGYVQRVANVFANDGTGTRGNLGAVVKAILLDDEARRGHVTSARTFGKVKEPVIRITQVLRAFDARPGPQGHRRVLNRAVDQIEDYVGQAPLESPSVFNFYLPTEPLGPNSSLTAPEGALLTEVLASTTNNKFYEQVVMDNDQSPSRNGNTRIRLSRELAMAGDVERLVEHLETLLLARRLPNGMREPLVQHLSSIPNTSAGRTQRSVDAILCIISSPYHLVQI